MAELTAREQRIKRLLYQSWYRGCKETDRILGYFSRAYLHTFSDAELDAYEEIMNETDKDLFNWLTGTEPLPDVYINNVMMQKILRFDVATANMNPQ